jgi:serine protease Do
LLLPISHPDFDFTEAIDKMRHSVVSITIAAEVGGPRNPQTATGSGSGFIFYQDDSFVYVATNNHVVENASQVAVSLDDQKHLPARVIGTDRDNDLAVLSVSLEALEESGIPFAVAVLGESSRLRMGDSVVAMGNALGEGQRTTQGIVSALGLRINIPDPSTGGHLILDVLQTDAAVNRGNSGGPLINIHGEVVGVITAKFMGAGIEGMGYVMPIDNVRDILEYLRETGSVVLPFMGIRHNEINEELREQFNMPSTGQLITYVTPGTPAHDAGLRRGDLIVRFGERRIDGFDAFIEALGDSRVGEAVLLGIYRNNEYRELTIILGAPR